MTRNKSHKRSKKRQNKTRKSKTNKSKTSNLKRGGFTIDTSKIHPASIILRKI